MASISISFCQSMLQIFPILSLDTFVPDYWTKKKTKASTKGCVSISKYTAFFNCMRIFTARPGFFSLFLVIACCVNFRKIRWRKCDRGPFVPLRMKDSVDTSHGCEKSLLVYPHSDKCVRHIRHSLLLFLLLDQKWIILSSCTII